jgi:hypothetical protein
MDSVSYRDLAGGVMGRFARFSAHETCWAKRKWQKKRDADTREALCLCASHDRITLRVDRAR